MSTILEPDILTPRHQIKKGEPAWDIALLFPVQGEWTEQEYLALDAKSNWPIELVDGCLEVLPMPTIFHQRVVQYLFKSLDAFVVSRSLGEVFVAPLPVRLFPGQLREPDILYVKPHRIGDRHKPPEGADLVIEVVSEGQENRERDLEIKRAQYAEAKIPEYWIVDPQDRKVTVLVLDGEQFRVHGEFGPGTQATSVLLPGFAVDVAAVFAAGEGPRKNS